MTIDERAASVIIEALPRCKGRPFKDVARILVDALAKKRISFKPFKATHEMFTRWQAHLRYLGTETGYGREYWWDLATEAAAQQGEWPVKIVPQTVEIAGEQITVDIEIRQSSTLATTSNLMAAYAILKEGAEQHGIVLPERIEA